MGPHSHNQILPSPSVQFPFPRCLAMPGPIFRHGEAGRQQTPHSFLLRSELLLLSLCHEAMEDGEASSAVGGRTGSKRR